MNRPVELSYNEFQYSTEYADYIMQHCYDQRNICNGSALLQAMEDGFLFEEFLASR